MIDVNNLIDLCADRIEISGYSHFRSHSPELLSLHAYLYPQCLYLSTYLSIIIYLSAVKQLLSIYQFHIYHLSPMNYLPPISHH